VAGNHDKRAALLRERLPAAIACVDQERFSTTVRRGRKKEVFSAGSADLAFVGVGDAFRLLVELKINAALDERQLERYLNSGWPVLVLARDPDKLVKKTVPHKHWLGVLPWTAVLPGLRDLRLPQPVSAQWHLLLDVMEAEGDFDPARPRTSAELKEAAKWLEGESDRLVNSLRGEIERRRGYGGNRKAFAERVSVVAPRAGRYWATLGFAVPPDGERAIWVRLRWLRSTAPGAAVVWNRAPARWGMKAQLDQAHARLVKSGFVADQKALSYTRPLQVILGARSESASARVELTSAIEDALREIVRSGVLSADIRSFERA
jgi:hypothetical protein